MTRDSESEKITFELPLATTKLLRRMRLELREQNIPVTQQMIVGFLIDKADRDVLSRHFASALPRRIGSRSKPKKIRVVRKKRR